MTGVQQAGPSMWCRPGRGPVRVIVGGIHGDEAAGADAVRDLVAFEPPSEASASWRAADGATIRLALGNPEALQAGTRGRDAAEDLNRCFGPEVGPVPDRVEQLRALAQGAALVVDLHQTHCDTPPLAVVRDTPAHLAMVAALGLEVAVVDTGVVFGPTMLSDGADRLGALGVTVECGRQDDPGAWDVARRIAARVLAGPRLTAPGRVRVYRLKEAVPTPGPGLRFLRTVGNTVALSAGEAWAAWDGGTLSAPRDTVLFLPRDDRPPGRPCALLADDLGWRTVRPDAAIGPAFERVPSRQEVP